jgi:hypothetical protein
LPHDHRKVLLIAQRAECQARRIGAFAARDRRQPLRRLGADAFVGI